MPALLFFLVTLAGPLAYVGFMDDALVRSSGWPAYALMISGAIGGAVVATRRRSRGSVLAGTLSVVFLGVFVYFFAFWARGPTGVPAVCGP